MCRRKLLQARGWHAISIPYFTWSTIPTAEEQQTYLRMLIPAAALQAASASPEEAQAMSAPPIGEPSGGVAVAADDSAQDAPGNI